MPLPDFHRPATLPTPLGCVPDARRLPTKGYNSGSELTVQLQSCLVILVLRTLNKG